MFLYNHKGCRYHYNKSLSSDGLMWVVQHELWYEDNFIRLIDNESPYILGEDIFRKAVDSDWVLPLEHIVITGI